MNTKSPPTSPLRECIEKLQPSTTLNHEWQQRAEEELNETPENYKQGINTLRLQVLSKWIVKISLRVADFIWEFITDDVNLNVPEDDEFLLRFLRARKFDSQKAFAMVKQKF